MLDSPFRALNATIGASLRLAAMKPLLNWENLHWAWLKIGMGDHGVVGASEARCKWPLGC